MTKHPNPSLDPENWDSLRRAGHEMVDDMLDYLRDVRERPAWQSVPDEVRQALDAPLPEEPTDVEAVYDDFQRNVLPYPLGNIHPRFWGWVCGTGTPVGMLADLLASGMNSTLFGAESSPIFVERQVLRWLREALGYPTDSSALLVTGGSMANLVGLTSARHQQYSRRGIDVKRDGVAGLPMTIACSAETHNSVAKAAGLLGLGQSSVRLIPTRDDLTIDTAALRESLRGHDGPLAIVANIGTVNSGAIDDLAELHKIAREHDAWLHADGAFGAIAAISPKLRPRIGDLALADSVAFDLHKWMYMPYSVGCILVRDASAHHATFRHDAAYLARSGRGMVGDRQAWPSELGPELTREFHALKVWMSLKVYGMNAYRQLVEQNVAQAEHLAERIRNTADLELLAPVMLNVVCFRFSGGDPAQLDEINGEIVTRIQERGLAVPSLTRVHGKAAIRVANTNHRTTFEDFDILADAVLAIGAELMSEATATR